MVITLYFVLFFSLMIYFEQQRLLMTPTPRQSGIIQAASVDGHQTIEALAERFNVTHQTIRRDVNRLANATRCC